MRRLLILLILLTSLPAARADGPGEKAYLAGQKAMEADRFDEAIGQFRLSLRLSPGHAPAHLGLAACCLAQGREPDAAGHLQDYLAACPGHFLIRWHLADVLLRLARPGEARGQLERFLVAAQLHPALAGDQVISCHTRLMEIAEQQGDDYAEHLNRGIGLFLLAGRKAELADPASRRGAEELLCKAAAELTLSELTRPDEARPAWYLHRVWSALAQRHPARRWLHAAARRATPGTLTPAEMGALHVVTAPTGEDGRR
ncbi:MAG: tetratricopeptide repeat protein [Gemmataceae bacterium]